MMDLVRLRQQLRQARQSLCVETQQQHAKLVMQQVMRLPLWSLQRHIAVSQSFDGEVDTAPLITALRDQGHYIYLPRLAADKTLRFLLWEAGAELQPNLFGILEPKTDVESAPSALDVIIMPLVGVDLQGNRLGMGGGYYDRTLGAVDRKPYLVGLAHDCQQVEQLPAQSWDVPLDALATESKLTVWRSWSDS